MKRSSKLLFPTLAAFALAWATAAEAASHREAPLIALDPAADNTDVYAFVSYDAANLARGPADRRVTFIENVNPGQDPSDGPNYFNFSDEVLYTINIDNDQDGKADDVVYEFRFTTEDRPVVAAGDLTSPLPYLGNPHITPALPPQGLADPIVQRSHLGCGSVQCWTGDDARLPRLGRPGHLYRRSDRNSRVRR